MRLSNIHFRDLLTFLGISGILLLTFWRYVETNACHCVVNTRTHFPTAADRLAIERLLREILRSPRFHQPPAAVLSPEDNNHGR